MKASEIVESIKEVLGMELAEIKVELEERELQNGTKITAEKFEEGASVFILTESGDEEEKIALPVGNYEMNDGTVLVVSEEGKIGEIREASDEVPQEEELAVDDGKEADIDDWAGLEKRVQQLEDAIADLKADKENKMSDNEDEMYSKKEKVEASKVELNSIEVAADPISHNPEKTVKKERVKFGNNRPMSTRDKVLQIINNN
jgi:hypothetical protein|tara:strand:+ start:720 stop:1328 length:609 start_codon:yes stop_codon:yes gene_type:complete